MAVVVLLAGSCGTGTTTVIEKHAPAKPAITQLNFYLDASTGMRGFMHPNAPGSLGSEFQRTVSEVLSNANDLSGVGKAYYFVQESTPKDTRVLRPTTYDEVNSTVSTGIKNPALGTEMPTMLREVLKQQAKPGTVSLIVSDFIYAPPKLDETWRVKINVKEALNTVPANKLALIIFAGTSEFRDKFFPGNRTHFQQLNGAKLPYYVWVLGEPTAVAAATPLLKPLLGPGFERLSYNMPAPPATVFEHFGNVGTWFLQKNGPQPTQPLTLTFSQNPTRQNPAAFAVGFNMAGAPAVETADLPLQLRLDAGDSGASLLSVQAAGALPKPPSSAALPIPTHVAKVQLERLPAGAAHTLRLVLPRSTPAWVRRYTTTNDNNIASQGPKTFLLSEVLQGVQDYYDQQPTGREIWALPIRVQPAD